MKISINIPDELYIRKNQYNDGYKYQKINLSKLLQVALDDFLSKKGF